jgi:hypothetical protein
MLHLRRLALCLSTSFLLALPTAAQVPQNEGEINLSATETYAVLAPAITPSTLIPFQVDVEGRDSDGFDVTVANAGAIVSLILPGGTEVNSLNADSLGFGFDVIPADSETVTIVRVGNSTWPERPSDLRRHSGPARQPEDKRRHHQPQLRLHLQARRDPADRFFIRQYRARSSAQ